MFFLYFFTIKLLSVSWTCPWRTRWWPWAWKTRLLRLRALVVTGAGILSLSPSGGPGAIWRTSGPRRGILRLPLAPPGVIRTLSAGRGATLVLQIEGMGLPAAILAPRLCGVRGLVGPPRMSGASAARHMAHPQRDLCSAIPSGICSRYPLPTFDSPAAI